jgi:hypothetical protein
VKQATTSCKQKYFFFRIKRKRLFSILAGYDSLEKRGKGTMSEKPKHTQEELQNVPLPLKQHSFLRHPGVLAGLIIFIGGCITFIEWTLPRMSLLSSPNRTFMTYAIVFAPTIFTILVITLAFLILRAIIDYRRREASNHQKGRSRLISAHEDRKQKQNSLERNAGAEIAMPLSSRRALTRRSTTAMLQQKRKSKFYQGREYKGKIHQTDLKRITTPLSPSSSSLFTQKDLSTPVKIDPDPIEVEKRDALFSEPDIQERLPLPDHSVSSQVENKFTSPSYETTEFSAQQLQPPISIYLLKEIIVEVQNEDGIKRVIPLSRKRREDGKYTERELLAYLASGRGQPAARDKLLESVFAYGLSDEKYSLTNLTNQFNKCTQFLRQDINKVAATLGMPALTIISSTRDEWRLLTEECRVIDLDEVERQYAVIAGIAGDDCLTPSVQQACQRLIDVYRGDFLENSIEGIVSQGGDDWIDNWVRHPYTTYRTKYFQALWYRAEFWRIRGDLSRDENEAEHSVHRNCYEMAAKLYREYALHVLTSFTQESAMLFDLEIKQRLSLGERALRASLDMYAATKNTQAGDALYLMYAQRMSILTQEQWKPRIETVEAWTKLKEQTNSHRFAPQVTPHDLSDEGE